MIVIPAIDLRNGRVVRLTQGQFSLESVYSGEPIEIARRFEKEGASRIHLVDLDGAREGTPHHFKYIEALAENTQVKFQVGGGIRTTETAGRYLEAGLHRVVVGTRACLDPVFLKEILGAFGESIIVGIDCYQGHVATDGWTRITEISAEEVLERTVEYGGKEVIFTDIDRDGALKGPNFMSIEKIVKSSPLKIIASGGVSGIEDIRRFLKIADSRLIGVIVGKAIYEGRLDLAEALELCGCSKKG